MVIRFPIEEKLSITQSHEGINRILWLVEDAFIPLKKVTKSEELGVASLIPSSCQVTLAGGVSSSEPSSGTKAMVDGATVLWLYMLYLSRKYAPKKTKQIDLFQQLF